MEMLNVSENNNLCQAGNMYNTKTSQKSLENVHC